MKALQGLSDQQLELNLQSRDNLEILKEEILLTSKASDQVFAASLDSKLYALVQEAKLRAEECDLLRALSFDGMQNREDNIADAHLKTFKWMVDDNDRGNKPGSSFMNWLKQGSGVYWVAGKAGCGKSCLMKYLGREEKVNSALQEWAGGHSIVASKFYFWNAGNDMQKSQVGLLRSILFEILRQVPSLIPHVFSVHSQVAYRAHKTPLFNAFKSITTQTAPNTKFFLLIDGLDEYDGDDSDITELISDFASSENVKICVSSRPWNVFVEAFGKVSDQTVEVQEYTKDDIGLYISENFERDPRFVRMKKTDERYQSLVIEITVRAQGVFLWVFLVIRSLIRGLTNADTVIDLYRRLNALPPDLEAYFELMLNSVETIYRPQTSRILLSCLGSQDSLSVMTASYLEENPAIELGRLTKPLEETEILTRCQDMTRRLNARCKDLLEVRVLSRHQTSLRYRIGFLHRTVRDFLRSNKLQKILRDWLSEPYDIHYHLCWAFLLHIKQVILGLTSSFPSGGLKELCSRLMLHARAFEETDGQTPREILDAAEGILKSHCKMPYQPETTGWFAAWKFPEHQALTNVSIFSIAISFGLKKYISYRLEKQPSLVHRCSERLPLEVALLYMNPFVIYKDRVWDVDFDLIALLLERGADPNDEILCFDDQKIRIPTGEGSTTVWVCFLQVTARNIPDADTETLRLYARVIEALIIYGADTTVKVKLPNGNLGDAAGVASLFPNQQDARRIDRVLTDVRESKKKSSPWLRWSIWNRKSGSSLY